MSQSKREDSTEQLIKDSEPLRAKHHERKRPPRTRALVRDAERLIGRAPATSGLRPLLTAAFVLALLAVVAAALYFVFA
jgi:hypothetical protein